MSNQLTMEEMQAIHDQMTPYLSAEGVPPALTEAIRDKMAAGMDSLRAQQAHAAEAHTETFPQRISQEEAHLYQARGMKMMMEAAKLTLDERTHADLSCMFVALLGGISQATNIPRDTFSNTLVANVGFTALKAAWVRGKAS